MKNRILSFALIAIMSLMLFGVKNLLAQGNRRGEPNVLSSGYYVVDSDDNAPTPWRPNYFFIDTSYQAYTWYRIKNGAQQFFLGDRELHYFYNPYNRTYVAPLPGQGNLLPGQGWSNAATMDTVEDCMAGPIPIGFQFSFYEGLFDSVFISSNGYLGFGSSDATMRAEAWSGNPPMYCSPKNPDLKTSPGNSYVKSAIFALFGDMDFRPYLDSSKVYIRNNPSQDSFFVSYYNLRLNPNSSSNGGLNYIEQGQGRDNLFIKKMQIVFTRQDSSIQINYGSFSGTIQGQPPVPAYRVFQRNCTIGLINASGQEATSVNYGSHSNKGRWDAVNTTCRACNKDFKQNYQYALKFKRWHNIVRGISVDFPPRNYEVCLSTSLTPIAEFMNVDVQQQDFKVKFQIRNVVTGTAVYGRTICMTGMGAGEIRKSGTSGSPNFTPYSTNPNILNQLGTFNACAIATSYDCNDNFIGDLWPFDDTVCLQIYGIRTTALPFNDPSDNYNLTQKGEIPDQTKWVSIGGQVADGDAVTFDPPPPRYDQQSGGVGPSSFLDPVIHLDRTDIDGNPYAGNWVGDTLVSFPFNLLGNTKATLAFSYQRTGNTTFPWLWDAQILVGPEKTILNANGSVYRPGDSLVVEFKNPSEPACNPSASGWRQVGQIDGGNDFEFTKFSVRLDKFTTPTFNYFTKSFRFRLREKAKDDRRNPSPDDDGDDFYVDNVSLQVPRKPEIEVMWVRVVSPYTHLPASQATTLPVYVHVANNSTDVAIAFPIRVQILDQNGNTLYWALETVTSLRGGTDSTILMPNWNAQNATTGGTFTVYAFLASSSYDSYTQDNGTFTKFFLDVGQAGDPPEFALDDNSNDWPGLVQVTGQGVGFTQNSGSFAMKFRLSVKDTLYGIRVYFANANQSRDGIRLSVLKGSPNSGVPTCDTVGGGIMESERMGSLFNQWWPYYFDKPIVLPGGTSSGPAQGYYWISVSQLSLEDYAVGADISRGGGRVIIYDPITPTYQPMYHDQYGTNIAQNNNFGDVSTSWAIERTASSCDWSFWMPPSGYWPINVPGTYFLTWYGVSATDINKAGGYTPMIRPMVSKSGMLPVDFMTPLTGKEVNGTALLNWSTAQEKNNQGFFVERRIAIQQDGFFEKIGFVDGHINSNTQNGYVYDDRNVSPGTYTYRLTQMDLDGAQHISNTVNVTIGSPDSYTLDQNYPNPCTTTQINFSLPISGTTRLVVYNALGQAVRTLVDGDVAQGSHEVKFDGKDDAGNDLASGNYIYRLMSGDFTATRKLTLAR